MKRVKELVTNWLSRIAVEKSVDYYDIIKEAEDIARRLLNQLLDLELENLNLTKQRNFPGVDLARESGFAVQVTSQKEAKKIRDSLEKFEKNEHYKDYPKGVRFFILSTEGKKFLKKTKESFTQCYRDFNPDEHIWDISWLLNRIAAICQSDRENDRDRFNAITVILEEEFGGGKDRKDWNSRFHLCCLPPVSEEYGFPRPPFRYLRRYRKEDARIFFGRSYYIRKLFESVTRTDSAAVTLLCGQSGVGKSSLLEAGLLPRIEGFSDVIYTRRNREKGLNGTLRDAINNFFIDIQAKPQISLIDMWKKIETVSGKPLILIIDQAEEVFTDPNSRQLPELYDFVKLIKNIFSKRSSYPRGRLVIGYRKEFHANFEAIFDKEGITDYCKLFLEPLDKEAIIEVVTGFTRTHELRDRYDIQVEERLPDIIANDLSVGKSTPVAPVLQFIMSKMWEMLPPDVSGFRVFTINAYRTLREQGTAIKDFFRMQMETLDSWNKEVVTSGLALDVLKFHCNPMATACSIDMEELYKVYRHRLDILEELVLQLKNLYLLTGLWGQKKRGEREEKVNLTSLVHDVLAPVVIDEHKRSSRPGQRAEIILSAKMGEFIRGEERVYLDSIELEILEQGRKGMKALTTDEEKLLRKSKVRKYIHEKEERRNRFFRNVSIALLFVFAIFAAIQWNIAYRKEKTSKKQLALNYWEKSHKARENILLIEAIHYFAEAVITNPDLKLHKTLLLDMNDLWNCCPLVHIFKQKVPFIRAKFNADGTRIFAYSEDNITRIWNSQTGKLIGQPIVHKKKVNGAMFNADGTRILTWSGDGTVQLWNADTGSSIRQLRLHKKGVKGVIYNANETKILTWSEDGIMRIWDVKDGKPTGKPMIHKGTVNGAIYNTDETMVLTWCNKLVRVWNVQSGNPLGRPMTHKFFVNGAKFSADETKILTWCNSHSFEKESEVRVWDVQNGTTIGHPMKHKWFIWEAKFDSDETRIITWSSDGNVRLWETRKGTFKCRPMIHLGPSFDSYKAIFNSSNEADILSWESVAPIRSRDAQTGKISVLLLSIKENPVLGMKFNSDKTWMLTWSIDGTSKLWDTQSGKLIGLPMGHEMPVRGVTFDDDKTQVFTWSDDGTARLWSTKNSKLINKTIEHKDSVLGAKFNSNDTRILTWSKDGTARQWDAQSGKLINKVMEHKKPVWGAVFNNDDTRILTWSGDGTARQWDAQSGKPIGQSMVHNNTVEGAEYNANESKILTWSEDGTARLWDARDGKPIGQPMVHGGTIYGAKFNTEETQIFTWSSNGTIQIWETQNCKPIGKSMVHRRAIKGAIYNTNETCILSWSDDNCARIWDARNGSSIGQPMLHKDGINGAIYNTDGTRILTWSDDGSARIWDAINGSSIGQPMLHEDKVIGAIFNADGTRILTWSFDSTARIWNSQNGKPVGVRLIHKRPVLGATFNNANTHILTYSYDDTARIWDIQSNKAIGKPMAHADIGKATFIDNDDLIFTWSHNSVGRLWDARNGEPIGQPMEHYNIFRSTYGASGVTFDSDETRIIIWGNDRKARLWEIGLDLDFPPDQIKLQAMVLTGAELAPETGKIRFFEPDEWENLKDRYIEVARKHLKKCRYRNANVYLKLHLDGIWKKWK